jgi:hypothetical protein
MPRTAAAGKPFNLEAQHVSFGMTDTRGRSMGYLIETSEIELVPASEEDIYYTFSLEPGHYFLLRGQYTVDQKPYGVSTNPKFFPSDSMRRFAIEPMLYDARSRAYNKTSEGYKQLTERRHQRYKKAALKRSSTASDKTARRAVKEVEAAARIPAIEAKIQAFLDDANFMDYLKAHPWPHVIPGPPSMKLTTWDHIVARSVQHIDTIRNASQAEDLHARHLDELKLMLQMLKEQAKRFSKGLPPESATLRKFFGG